MSIPSFKPIHVLIAIGDKARLKTYSEFLTRDGFRVTTSTSALGCWAELECHRPDVLVLEQDLPCGGGDGVVAMMDDEPEIRGIPVILLAGAEANHGELPLPNREYLRDTLLPRELAAKIHRFDRLVARGQARRLAGRWQTVREDAA